MVQVSDPRIIWWLNERPTLTLDQLMDDAAEDMLVVFQQAHERFSSGAQKLPAAEQGWRDSHLALCTYGALLSQELRLNRGNDPGTFWTFANYGKDMVRLGGAFSMPVWYQDEDIMRSHWSAGIRHKAIVPDVKCPWDEVDEYWPVLWPVLTETGYELRVSKSDKEAMASDDLWLPDDISRRVANL